MGEIVKLNNSISIEPYNNSLVLTNKNIKDFEITKLIDTEKLQEEIKGISIKDDELLHVSIDIRFRIRDDKYKHRRDTIEKMKEIANSEVGK